MVRRSGDVSEHVGSNLWITEAGSNLLTYNRFRSKIIFVFKSTIKFAQWNSKEKYLLGFLCIKKWKEDRG